MNASTATFSVLVGTVAVFSAVMGCLTIPTKTSKKVISIFASLSIVGALLMYGYGYGVACGEQDLLAAVFRAVFASLRIFGGSNAWDDVSIAFPNWWEQLFFWLVHMMGLFTTASAVLATLGSGLLRRIRLYLWPEKNIALIYGLNARTLEFGRAIVRKKNTFVVYVDPNPDNTLSAAADKMGAICRSDAAALEGNDRFLKSIGMRPGKSTIRLYALGRDQIADNRYARSLMNALQARKIEIHQTSLTILGPEDETENTFQFSDQSYGYGSVISVNEPELAARMLVQTYPPCDHMTFRPDGSASSGFHGLIIGFGQVGQAVLRQLVVNGQFHGSSFRLDVFDPYYEQIMGRLAYDCAPMLEHYDIHFHPYDGRSRMMYQYIAQNKDTLNYIVLCTGDAENNIQLSRQLSGFLAHRGCQASIYLCSTEAVCRPEQERLQTHALYVPSLLCTDQIDRRAMAINHYYVRTGDILSNWRSCRYFHRMSSRAAADFYNALLCAAGTTAEKAKAHWAPEGELLENLARTEHLRWVAFHYCMGFRPMTEEELRQRAVLWQQGKLSGKLNQDLDRRLHACMIPWEELDALSRLQSELSGKTVDHKETDRNSIRTLADVLRTMDT